MLNSKHGEREFPYSNYFVVGNVPKCHVVFPPYLATVQQGNVQHGEIIARYYDLGMNYEKILLLIRLIHNYYLRIRQL